jgi:hypothetical protein
MTDAATLDPASGKLLGVLTLLTMQRAAADAVLCDLDDRLRELRMARIGPVVLIEEVGTRRPREIACYLTEDSEVGKPFKIDPARRLFLLQAESRAMPPDWQLVPVCDPASPAFEMAARLLLSELAAHDPEMRARLAEAGIGKGALTLG